MCTDTNMIEYKKTNLWWWTSIIQQFSQQQQQRQLKWSSLKSTKTIRSNQLLSPSDDDNDNRSSSSRITNYYKISRIEKTTKTMNSSSSSSSSSSKRKRSSLLSSFQRSSLSSSSFVPSLMSMYIVIFSSLLFTIFTPLNGVNCESSVLRSSVEQKTKCDPSVVSCRTATITTSTSTIKNNDDDDDDDDGTDSSQSIQLPSNSALHQHQYHHHPHHHHHHTALDPRSASEAVQMAKSSIISPFTQQRDPIDSLNGIPVAFGDLNSDRFVDAFFITDGGYGIEVLKGESCVDGKTILTYFGSHNCLSKWTNIHCTFVQPIVNVVLSDFTGHNQLDLLITTKQINTNVSGSGDDNDDGMNDDSLLQIWLVRGTFAEDNEVMFDCAQRQLLIENVQSEPIVLDYNGDMIADFIVQLETCNTWLWLGGYYYQKQQPPQHSIITTPTTANNIEQLSKSSSSKSNNNNNNLYTELNTLINPSLMTWLYAYDVNKDDDNNVADEFVDVTRRKTNTNTTITTPTSDETTPPPPTSPPLVIIGSQQCLRNLTKQKLAKPHSSAFINLNSYINDLSTDLYWNGVKKAEYIFTTSTYAFAHKPPPPAATMQTKQFSYPLETVNVPTRRGQSAFGDFNYDGTIDHLIPVCLDTTVTGFSKCKKIGIMVLNSDTNEWINVLDDSESVVIDISNNQTTTTTNTNHVLTFAEVNNLSKIIENFSNQTTKTKKNYQHINIPVTLRVGDLDYDGYPDLTTVVQDIDTGRRFAAIFLNYKDERENNENENASSSSSSSSSSSINPLGRVFRLVWTSESIEPNPVIMVTLFDLYNNGRLNLLLTVLEKDDDNDGDDDNDDQHHNLTTIYTTTTTTTTTPNPTVNVHLRTYPFDYSVDKSYYYSFLRVSTISGRCSDKANDDAHRCPRETHIALGTNPPGVMVCFEGPYSEEHICGGQLIQSAHFAANLPYIVFGLGKVLNVVNDLIINIPSGTQQSVNIIRQRSWDENIPGSNLVVIPYQLDRPEQWEIRVYINMSIYSVVALAALTLLCILLSIAIYILHWREKKEDHQEHIEYKKHWLT